MSVKSEQEPWVTIIIPARDEAASVGQVVEETSRFLKQDGRYRFEILVVDDASTDNTGDEALKAGARVVRNSRQRGYGASLKRGIHLARGKVLATVDADGTYPVGELPEMLSLMKEGADQVIGARTASDARIPLIRRPAKKAVTWFAAQLTRCEIPDLNSGLRCFERRRVRGYLRMLPDGFSFSTSVTVASLLDGWEVRWHPIGYRKRVGSSHFRAFHDTSRLLLSLMRAVMYCDPLKLFLPVAIAFGIAGLGFGAWDVLWANNLTDKTVLFTISSLELFVLGLLADMIVKKL